MIGIQKQLQPDEVSYEEDLALVAVVGRGMKQVPGASGQFLSEFESVSSRGAIKSFRLTVLSYFCELLDLFQVV